MPRYYRAIRGNPSLDTLLAELAATTHSDGGNYNIDLIDLINAITETKISNNAATTRVLRHLVNNLIPRI